MQIYNGASVEQFIEWMFHDQPQEARTSICRSMQDVMDDLDGVDGFLGIRFNVDSDLAIACYAMLYPGKLAVITGPQLIGDFRAYDQAELVSHASDICTTLVKLAYQKWSVEMVQSTIPKDLDFESAALRQAGFEYLATLHQLVLLLPHPDINRSSVANAERWQMIQETDLPLVHDWLNATYQDTLDCPELSSLRSTTSAMEGYWKLATGTGCKRLVEGFVRLPAWWMKLDEADGLPNPRIQAAYMLTPIQPATWELTYFGVAWQYRRKQLGEEMLNHAIDTLEELKARQLFAYVDSRNEPAIKLYDRAGFRYATSFVAWHYPSPINQHA